MTTPRRHSGRRSAFTLVELLTVIGIISLLIGILVPSLSRARDVAKKTKSLALISSIEKSLEVFENDYKAYPESGSDRVDPILGLGNPAITGNVRLMGAHWLARALSGPDTLGLDLGGLFLKDKDKVTVDTNGRIQAVQGGGSGVQISDLRTIDRKGAYIEDPKVLIPDNDASKFSIAGPTGRLVIVDAFNFPVLYYKASPRARPYPFRNSARSKEGAGVYDQRDNIGITGGEADNVANNWDFAGTGQLHGLGYFGPSQSELISANPTNPETANPPDQRYKGKNFADYFHEHRAHETGNVIKPVKPDSFVLISAGKDGLYGTDDDVNNFDK